MERFLFTQIYLQTPDKGSKERIEILNEDNNESPKYNPNIDRFKGTEAYVFGNMNMDEEIENKDETS